MKDYSDRQPIYNANRRLKYATDKKYRDKIIKKRKEYKKRFPDRIKSQESKYKKSEKGKMSRKRDRVKNKEYYDTYIGDYSQREDIKERRNMRNRQRVQDDPNFAIKKRLRNSLLRALTLYTRVGKIMRSKKYGIDFNAIINHLKPFPKDISKYHVDHIIPLFSFNLMDPDEVKKAFAPENHQWLTIEENLKKGATLPL